MARPIRIEFPNAYYHVTSRGNARQNIFHGAEDFSTFLDILGAGCGKYMVRVYAFVLMTNHYHLLVQTEQANLSVFMQHLNGGYTQQFNRRHRRVGHVTQGRYKAILVEDESYFSELIRYIHLNPYRAGMVREIDDYLYSSHQAILNSPESRKWTEWYDAERILRHFGTRASEALRQYRAFLDDGKRHQVKNLLDEAHFGYILGSESLVKWVQEHFLSRKDDREYRGLKEIKCAQVNAEDIISEVSRVMAVSREAVVRVKKGKGEANVARLIALYLIHKNCSISQRETGHLFGGVSNVAISACIRRFIDKYKSDSTAAKAVVQIAKALNLKT